MFCIIYVALVLFETCYLSFFSWVPVVLVYILLPYLVFCCFSNYLWNLYWLFWLCIDKKIIPKAANDIKLISAGKILENNKTVGQCRVPFGELPKGVITMHVVVQPSLLKAKTGRFHSRTYRVIIFCHLIYASKGSSM